MFDDVGAYGIENGRIRSILDGEIHQIDGSELDKCSVRINGDYELLSNLEFGNS